MFSDDEAGPISANVVQPLVDQVASQPYSLSLQSDNITAVNSESGSAAYTRQSYHPSWNGNSNVTLEIGNTLFVVPTKLLQHSKFSNRMGFATHEETIIVCGDATVLEVENLLLVLDTPVFSDALDHLDMNQWEAVLALATKWDIAAVRDHAITVFDKRFQDQDPLLRLDLALKCKVPKWFQPAYRQLCERTTSLTVEEAERLGIRRYAAIIRIREELQRQRFEALIKSIDDRLDSEQVHLQASYLSKGGDRRYTTAYGTPFKGKHICRDQADKLIVLWRLNLTEMINEAEELKAPF